MKPSFIHLKSTDSTNTFLIEKVAAQNIADTVVFADEQSHGKGLGSNIWESEPKKNLTFSIALNTGFIGISDQFQLSQSVAVALHKFLSNYLDTNKLLIKWPNDILYDNQKLSGVLISNLLKNNKMDLSIVGIGINVNQTEFLDWPTHPVSMKMITGYIFDLEELLHSAVDSIYETIKSLRQGGYPAINDYYLGHLYRYRQWGDYSFDDKVKHLFMKGLDVFGRLVLCDEDSNEFVFDVKQIKFV